MLVIILCGLAGLVIGSFINVLILRTRAGTNWVHGRSECPHCKKPLKVYDLIPVLSYISLRGRCRYCHKAISAQYPLVEATTAIIFAALAWHFHPNATTGGAHLIFWLLISIPLVAAAVYDLRWEELPDRFTVSAIVLAVIGVLWLQFGAHQAVLAQRILGTAFFGGGIYLIWLFSGGRWIGDGDIRLAVLMGLLFNTSALLLSILLSFNLAAIVSIGLMVSGRKGRHDHIPLGIFLVAGIYLTLFFGSAILNWYGNLLGIRL